MKAYYKKYTLLFHKPGGTSRGVLWQKPTYFIFLADGSKTAVGECNRFLKLSYDDREGYEEKLEEVCNLLPTEMSGVLDSLKEWPSVYFGVEMLLKDWQHGCQRILFPEVIKEYGFSIPVNGLIWMGAKSEMKKQVEEKLKQGYTSLKLKIGAIDFDAELELMAYIRKQFNAAEVEIRVDANGAFGFEEAKVKLQQLAQYEVSYIEQPIPPGQWQEMAALAESSPVKIALDEELIGIINETEQEKLITTIAPQLLILKPALTGGFDGASRWKQLIEATGGRWIITSALESNIGLNAIAQYAATGHSHYAQGLGTGQLYTNNFESPYTADAKGLHYNISKSWDLSSLFN
ncbi:MAG: o-succinylbenzoate synthase [Chitinophagaceae bacterium]|nr:o-succinylbenzoate synthase [Chitinophagaceae bacterium]